MFFKSISIAVWQQCLWRAIYHNIKSHHVKVSIKKPEVIKISVPFPYWFISAHKYWLEGLTDTNNFIVIISWYTVRVPHLYRVYIFNLKTQISIMRYTCSNHTTSVIFKNHYTLIVNWRHCFRPSPHPLDAGQFKMNGSSAERELY